MVQGVCKAIDLHCRLVVAEGYLHQYEGCEIPFRGTPRWHTLESKLITCPWARVVETRPIALRMVSCHFGKALLLWLVLTDIHASPSPRWEPSDKGSKPVELAKPETFGEADGIGFGAALTQFAYKVLP
jgi:hypothetical protein